MEISMYPLSNEYEHWVVEFINRLKANPEIHLKVNPTSTHVYGAYDVVFQTLQTEIKTAFEEFSKSVFVMKVLHGNLKDSLEGTGL